MKKFSDTNSWAGSGHLYLIKGECLTLDPLKFLELEKRKSYTPLILLAYS